jgi:hypothetical protein
MNSTRELKEPGLSRERADELFESAPAKMKKLEISRDLRGG